jgi:dTDP-4-dehydrorhamnose 3,5-epimerase/CDP-3, 6-dideoxy-D-glycero-D-glycero-4-hexulose-5-epimerase
MTFENTKLKGVYIINNFNAVDDRGLFVKTFNKKQFQENILDFEIRESYYSVSNKNVIRGMHFQLPPYDHEKLVYVAKGSILDVIVDLRKKSKTYKQYISINLSEGNMKSIFIPKGLAHGFKSLDNDTITVYNVATEYNNTVDSGISYDSFGFDWEVKMPILSARDASFNTLKEFHEINPFS